MLLADDSGGEDAGGGGERIDGGVDAEFGEGAGEQHGGVEVGEGGGGGGVGEVVGGHVDGLDGGDGAFFGGGDALLQLAHFGGEVGLVADGGGHAAEEGGDLGAGLGEAEDVVDEEQGVGAFFVAEVFGDGEAGEGDAEAGTWRLGHLSVDEGGLAFGEVFEVDDAGFLELDPEVVALACAFADAGEDGEAAVFRGHVVDEFLDDDGFADAGAAEEADFAAFQEGEDEVDDLDAGFEHFLGGGLFVEGGGLAMDGEMDLGVDGPELVDGLSEHVHHATKRRATDGNGDAGAGVDGLHTADHAFGGDHGDAADAAFAEVLLDLDDDVERLRDVEAFADDAERLEDGRHLCFFELNVNGRAADGDNFSDVFCHGLFRGCVS